jgi:regulatory protein
VRVYVDGAMRLEVSPPVAASLAIGQAVDDSLLADLENRQAVEGAMGKAGRLLARRPRSEAELRKALREAGGSEEVIGAALTRLKEAGQVDDEAFARAWLENRSTFRPRSRLALRAELARKGLPREAVDRALDGFSEEQAALQAARRAWRRWGASEAAERRQRVYEYLQRRGFGHETISAAVRHVAEDPAASKESEETS